MRKRKDNVKDKRTSFQVSMELDLSGKENKEHGILRYTFDDFQGTTVEDNIAFDCIDMDEEYILAVSMGSNEKLIMIA